jgi:hypothetical protein
MHIQHPSTVGFHNTIMIRKVPKDSDVVGVSGQEAAQDYLADAVKEISNSHRV